MLININSIPLRKREYTKFEFENFFGFKIPKITFQYKSDKLYTIIMVNTTNINNISLNYLIVNNDEIILNYIPPFISSKSNNKVETYSIILFEQNNYLEFKENSIYERSNRDNFDILSYVEKNNLTEVDEFKFYVK